MMNELLAGLEIMAAQEKKRAEKENGATFHSPHEAYGVIAEELMEARTEMSCLTGAEAALLRVIHRNDPELYRNSLIEARKAAMNAAAELVQVAAMCNKAIYSLDMSCTNPLGPRNRNYEIYALGEWGPET